MDTVARYAFDHGYHTIIEGIFYAAHCANMLTALRADHRGGSHFHYTLDATVGRILRDTGLSSSGIAAPALPPG